MLQINIKEVIQKYNSLEMVWDPKDKWHIITHEMIGNFIHSGLQHIPTNHDMKILNAGSAGNNYGMETNDNLFQIDIAHKNLKANHNAIIGNIEMLPLRDKSFNLIICVGSVLNYCDPQLVLREFTRVLKLSGYIILEFESSYTFELLGRKSFNKGVTFVKTFYNGTQENIWYFSEKYIYNLFQVYGYSILMRQKCHILSPLIYRITKNENIAAKFARFDKLCLKIPIIEKFSSNTIILAKKL